MGLDEFAVHGDQAIVSAEPIFIRANSKNDHGLNLFLQRNRQVAFGCLLGDERGNLPRAQKFNKPVRNAYGLNEKSVSSGYPRSGGPASLHPVDPGT